MNARHDHGSITDVIFGIAAAAARHATRPVVYPGYLASRIKSALKGIDPTLHADQQIVASLGAIETLGSCRYAIPVIDCHGTEYRITVEVIEHKAPAGAA